MLLLSVAGLASAPFSNSGAQSLLSAGTIGEIAIEGGQRIDPATVLNYLGLRPGDSFDARDLDAALSRLFATGLFVNAVFEREGDKLIVRVVENPLINIVAFEGNDRLDNATLQSELQSKPRTVFTRSRVQSDTQRLLEIYRRTGRFGATVDPKIIRLDQNRVNLVFEIDEGKASEVDSINFIGNKEFSDGRLREVITTSESDLLGFFATNDSYDPERLNFDKELLRRFYLSEGYADFQVLSVVAELARNNKDFIITFTLVEGERYAFGMIDVVSTINNFAPKEIANQITSIEGETYDATEVEESVEAITDAVGNLGFAFVEVIPRVDRNDETRTIGITYDIQQGPKVFVERIEINGNVRTVDDVIRRQFTLAEGDAFNTTELARSRRRIQNLGFFRTVDATLSQGSVPDRTVITANVEEQSTGNLSFGAGFSTDSGPIGNIAITERNLLGLAQDLRLDLVISGDSSQIDLSYTDPYFLDEDLSVGFDLFRTTNEQSSSDFDQKNAGFGLRAGWDYENDLRHVVRYRFDRQDIDDVSNDAAEIIQDDEGVFYTSAVGSTLTLDKRNSRFDPTDGYVFEVDNSYTGLSGSSYYFENTVGGAYYTPIFDINDLTLRLSARAGNIASIEPTRVSERFFIGGADLRGFESGGVGPRDKASGDALGAKNFLTGSIALIFPLGLPQDLSVRGRVFNDIGSAWGIDGDKNGVQDSVIPRASAGVGITWGSPLGPLVVDLAYAYAKQDFDVPEVFRFSFGTRF
ncbi:MAG: outer membrane protein assembly factor BamA [Rhodospirillales bacterium]|nr:outer membrane protein assembly factor BamA [Rhodospirillales bacterium]